MTTTRVYKLMPATSGPTRKREAAFTLLEAMVGAVILVIVFGSLLITMSYGFAVIRASRESSRATQIILERMEGIRLYNWDQLGMIDTNFSGFFYPPDETSTNGGVVYHGSMFINNVTLNTSYAANMRLVTVSVLWNSDGIPRQRSMSTFVSQNGIQNYVFTH
jgi:type II secretory pathway pseudopilin PulG